MSDTRVFPIDIDRICKKMKEASQSPSSDVLKATMDIGGAKLDIAYDASAKTLTVTILHKPILATDGMVWSRISEYL
jgi:hypothetical protein